MSGTGVPNILLYSLKYVANAVTKKILYFHVKCRPKFLGLCFKVSLRAYIVFIVLIRVHMLIFHCSVVIVQIRLLCAFYDK